MSVPGMSTIMGATHWFHPFARVWLLQDGMSLFYQGYNIDTKKQVLYNVSDPTFIEAGFYYAGSYWGVGFTNDSFTMRGLAKWTLNPLTLASKWEIVASIPGYFIIESGMIAFDFLNGVVYTLLQPSGGNPQTTPMELVSFDLSGNKLYHPKMCHNNCPWTIAFLF